VKQLNPRSTCRLGYGGDRAVFVSGSRVYNGEMVKWLPVL